MSDVVKNQPNPTCMAPGYARRAKICAREGIKNCTLSHSVIFLYTAGQGV